MRFIGKLTHYIAWTFAVLQIGVLLSACLSGFSAVQLGLAVFSQVGFFAFLFISTMAEAAQSTVRADRAGRVHGSTFATSARSL